MIIKYCVVKHFVRDQTISWANSKNRETLVGDMIVCVDRQDINFIDIVVEQIELKFPSPGHSCIAFEIVG
jgi:hypothetical protein